MTTASCMPHPKQIKPSIIDEKAWKKAMGLFVFKTGVSEKLRAVEAGFAKIDLAKLDAHECTQTATTPGEFDKAKQIATEYLDKSLNLIMKPVVDLQNHLVELIPEFKKDKLCPKTTVTYAQKLLNDVKEYRDVLEKSFAELDDNFDKRKTQVLKNLGVAANQLVKYDDLWPGAFDTLKKNLSKAKSDHEKLTLYGAFRCEYIRGFSTSLPYYRKNPTLAKHDKIWVPLAQDSAQPKEAQKIDVLLSALGKYYDSLSKDLKAVGITK